MKNFPDTTIEKISLLFLRVFGSGIFIIAGIGHLLNSAGTAARLESAPMGHLATGIASAETLVVLSGYLLLVGGLMLLAGYKTRLASLLLIAMLIPITLTVQVGSADALGPLFKNIAIFGILLFTAVNGSMAYSVDEWQKSATSSESLNQPIGTRALFWLAIPFFFASATTISAETNLSQDQTDYAILISQPQHLKASLHTAETLFTDAQFDAGEVVIVSCGAAIEALVEGSEYFDTYREGVRLGVSFVACGMTVNNMEMDPSILADEVEIVPNGLTYLFELKHRGFVTVEL